jgi:membrane fusion protein (multidrug efflux system)
MTTSRVQTLIVLLISLSLSECNACGQKPRDEAPKVTVATVQSKSFTIRQQYVCQIHSRRHIEVCTLIDGIAAAIQVREGQRVKQGDLLFQILPFKDEENQDRFATIKAPYDGLIGRLTRQQGSVVKEGDSLTTLSDDSVMWVYFRMPEKRYLEYMAESDRKYQSPTIELILADHSKFPHPGKVGAIEASFGNETGDIAFRADFPNPDGLLRHDQRGTLVINRVLKDAIVIPQRATFEGLNLSVRTGGDRIGENKKMTDKFPPDNPIASYLKGIGARFEVQPKRYVYVVGKDHFAHRREIIIQDETEDLFVVEKGVAVGDKIVLEGVRLVRDGDRVD